ncbi:MAG: flippase, partial [Candidatus Bathyarchaeota archaeon]|nr:flippase [Candidatus Bathyarchaeota archaeon]
STIISAVGIVFVALLLTEDEYGLYTIAFISPALFTLFRDWGIGSAMIKHLAQYRSENRITEMKNVLASGLLFKLALGIILFVICFSLAGFLATNVFHRPPETKLYFMIQIASIIILTDSIVVASQSTFIGFERMEFNSLTMICQSCLKAFLAPLLVLLGYSTVGAVLGHTIAALVTGALAVMILYFMFYKKTYGAGNDGLNLGDTLRTLLRYGLPLSPSIILTGLLPQFYSFMMVIYCSNLMIGNYSVAVQFSVLITFFTMPIATVLFPAFSKLDSEREMETLRMVFQSSVKYAALLTVPVTFAIMVLSKPLVSTLFGGKYGDAPLFLTLMAAFYLYSGLGTLSLGNFLNGQGETRVTTKLALITLGFGLPLSLALIPAFGITGLIVTTLVAGIPSLAVGLWWVRKHFGVAVNWRASAKIFLASAIAATVTQTVMLQLDIQDWVKLVVGGIIFLATYFIVAPLTRAVDKSDIDNLREMLSDLKPFSKLFDIPLSIMEKLLTIFAV